MTTSQRLAVGGIALALVALFVAMPAIIASVRQHPERRTILKLAPFGAVSFVLWGALIVWATSATTRSSRNTSRGFGNAT